MEKQSRTKAVIVNSSFAVIAQFLNLFLSFIVRTLLIKLLGSEVNGLNGLFSNIVNILSFAELGIGSAISYSLYKPLAEGDRVQVAAIMALFKRVYNGVAAFIALVGILLSFFVQVFIHGSTGSVGNVQVAFLLFIANVVFSYMMSYKRTLLIANQQGYVDSLNRMIFTFGSQTLQIIGLLILPDYYIFLIIQALSTIVSNLPIIGRVNREFPYLSEMKNNSVKSETVLYLKKNVAGMLSFKVGNIVIVGTDNIILSSFLGLHAVGMYANYTLIITGLVSLLNSVVNAITSSIGNLANGGNPVKERQVFLQFNMVNALLSFAVALGLIILFPFFISAWLGKYFVLSNFITLIIVINFFVGQLRNGLINYLNAYGLYWQQRYKSVIEATMNLVVSLILVMFTPLGIAGVLLGTLSSYLLVDFIWEPRIVVKHAIKLNIIAFYIYYGSQIILGIFLFGLVQQFAAAINLEKQTLFTALPESAMLMLLGTIVFHGFQIGVSKFVNLDSGSIFTLIKRYR
ncbi:lipopolysaccharide biosynthesis protein [Weissella confusa]|uniref:lipopolysaccharide biosynthesis protein n=1 Tax=Weissella confusa TaxID=1583 RepID=UPI0018F20DDC|nr:lipopolysaccharide biosynthesis protein [Weissella confusa]MBJ7670816.1 lipopolysaccharide biosynthesis protein [Weissella confusa]